MPVTVLAARLVASQSKRKRQLGFSCFLLSNVPWVVWGLHDAYALIVLQFALAALNVRGAYKTSPVLDAVLDDSHAVPVSRRARPHG